jgi:rhomboid protease GluP
MRPLTERLSPTVRNLIVAVAVVFGVAVMARGLREPIATHLALGPGIWAGELWQPVTSLFVHTELWNFFFNVLGLWFVGATIERIFGRRRFLVLFFLTGIVANLVVAGLIGLLGMGVRNEGCGDSVLGLFVALGVAYGRTPVRVFGQLVLQARVLAWIFVGMAVVSLLLQQAWPLLGGTLVAQGLAYVLAGGKLGPLTAFLQGLRGRQRSSLQVLEGGRTKRGKNYVN